MPPRIRFQSLAFTGSFLAFCLELASAKLLLPRFGGSAYVWTGSMMFFQALLLVAYVYARWARRHQVEHAGAVLLPFLFLPLALPPALGHGPFVELAWALLRSVGVPFFVLSTTVVVADDGYSLFAASNAGAFCGLLAYPFLIEPLLPASGQGRLWLALYAVYGVLYASTPSSRPKPPATAKTPTHEKILWLLTSAAPCAALLAVTNFLSMDFAAVPLLWTAPLAVYLATFVLNFQRDPWYPEKLNLALIPTFALAAALARLSASGRPLCVLLGLFALCMILHRTLARARPQQEEAMPEYYGWIAAGGLLGSLAVGLAVPLLGRHAGAAALDWIAVGGLSFTAILARDWKKIKPVYLAAAIAGALAASLVIALAGNSGAVYSLRNFYGVNSVRDEGGLRRLFHGNTEHGMQSLDPKRRREPLSYYAPASPLDDAFKELGGRWTRIGIVGLGSGGIAAYGRKGMLIDFYELDPDVADIARRWFTFLEDSPAKTAIVLGDGRLSLEKSSTVYDVLILDAFNSGAIPVHLLTKEAFAVYAARLAPGGVVLVHASNRYLDLRGPLAATARGLGWLGAEKRALFAVGKEKSSSSAWVALTRDGTDAKRLIERKGWGPLENFAGKATAWTDAHASLLSALIY